MNGSEVSLALVAIVGSVITALFKLLADNTKALKKLAESNDQRTRAEKLSNKKLLAVHEKTAREAEERNGHLGKQNVEIIKISKEISKNMAHLSNQEVGKQHVQNQVVERKD